MAPPPLDNEERRLQGGRVRVAPDKGHPPRPLVAIFRKIFCNMKFTFRENVPLVRKVNFGLRYRGLEKFAASGKILIFVLFGGGGFRILKARKSNSYTMRTLIAFSFMIPVLSNLCFTKTCGSYNKPQGAAKAYEYRYDACMAYPLKYYKVFKDSTGTILLAWLKDCGPDVTVLKGTEEILEKIGALAEQYKLHKLKASYYPSMQIMDGYSWNLAFLFEKESIYSDGRNAWPPKDLLSGIEAINDYLQSLIDASTEDDVLDRKEYREFINGK